MLPALLLATVGPLAALVALGHSNAAADPGTGASLATHSYFEGLRRLLRQRQADGWPATAGKQLQEASGVAVWRNIRLARYTCLVQRMYVHVTGTACITPPPRKKDRVRLCGGCSSIDPIVRQVQALTHCSMRLKVLQGKVRRFQGVVVNDFVLFLQRDSPYKCPLLTCDLNFCGQNPKLSQSW